MFLSLIIIIIMFNRKLYDTYHIIPNPEERREITWIVSSKYISFTKQGIKFHYSTFQDIIYNYTIIII